VVKLRVVLMSFALVLAMMSAACSGGEGDRSQPINASASEPGTTEVVRDEVAIKAAYREGLNAGKAQAQAEAVVEIRNLKQVQKQWLKKAKRRAFVNGFGQGVKKGIGAGYESGYAAAFSGFTEPWRPGHWYLVKMKKDGEQLFVGIRAEIEPDSGIAYSVEGDQI
jgi:hypothetical protein